MMKAFFTDIFRLKKKTTSCNFQTSMSSIEVLVSLTKYFHIKKIKNCNWFFVKLKLVKKLQEKKIKKFFNFFEKKLFK